MRGLRFDRKHGRVLESMVVRGGGSLIGREEHRTTLFSRCSNLASKCRVK
jgi:hypothetical protein